MSLQYNFEKRESWLKSFQPNYEKQKWHNNKVYHPTDIRNYDFFKSHKNYKALINPKHIVGIEYAYGYNCPIYEKKNIDWNYMLRWLKRLDRVINNFKDKKSLIEHIHNDNDPKSVLKYGNQYFTTSGQHRLCLAKYLEVENVEVYVQEYKLDKTLFVREKYLEKVNHKLIDYGFSNREYNRELNYNLLQLNIGQESILIHKTLIKNLINRYELLKKKKYKVIPSILKTIYSPSKNNGIFKNEDELYILNYKIYKHFQSKKKEVK